MTDQNKRMNDSEYLNIMTYGKPTGTINIVPHPQDVIDVDPFIIASMKARLNGESLSDVYDLTDRAFDELQLLREKNKLKKVFGSLTQLQDAYSSIKNLKQIQEEMSFEDVDKELLSKYSFMISRENNVDEYDFYRTFLFNENLVTKTKRAMQIEHENEFEIIITDYKEKHFEPLKITKEAIQMCSNLQSLFKERKLATHFDEFLAAFYGAKV
jgi:hypothetical protein